MASSTRKAVDLLSMYDEDSVVVDESSPADSAPPLKTFPDFPSPSPFADAVEARKAVAGALGIVDYGQDDSPLSPDSEDMEVQGSGRVMVGAELELGTARVVAIGAQVTSPLTHSSCEIEGFQTNEPPVDYAELQREAELLAKFLPPAPGVQCSVELQEKINKFLAFKKTGKSFNPDLKNMDYKNPDFMLHAVTYQEIDQVGTCFSRDVFDPHGYDPSDYYDVIRDH